MIFDLGLVALTDMERAIIRDLVCRVLQFLPQLTKAVNFAAELDWYA
jgi:DNA mismatch repair protein MSH5